MPLLITAKQFVDEWGTLEVGRSLSKKQTIDAEDNKAAYDAVILDVSTASGLVAAVETELNRVIDRAESYIRLHIEKLYGWPVTKDGFSTEAHPTLVWAVKIVSRYYLCDEAYIRDDMPQVVKEMYDECKAVLLRIHAGEYELDDIDTSSDDTINYVI